VSERTSKLLDEYTQRADRPIVQRDDGQYQIGLHDDAPGPFQTRNFAQSVASARYSGDDPPPKRRRPPMGNRRPLKNRLDRAAATHQYTTPESLSTGSYRAVAPNGLLIGCYRSRPEAAQASGVAS
jgi:hypothetical protein